MGCKHTPHDSCPLCGPSAAFAALAADALKVPTLERTIKAMQAEKAVDAKERCQRIDTTLNELDMHVESALRDLGVIDSGPVVSSETAAFIERLAALIRAPLAALLSGIDHD